MSYKNLEIWQIAREVVIDVHNALSSNDETIDHLETLFETGSLTDEGCYLSTHEKVEHLGKKLNNFISSVEKHHNT